MSVRRRAVFIRCTFVLFLTQCATTQAKPEYPGAPFGDRTFALQELGVTQEGVEERNGEWYSVGCHQSYLRHFSDRFAEMAASEQLQQTCSSGKADLQSAKNAIVRKGEFSCVLIKIRKEDLVCL